MNRTTVALVIVAYRDSGALARMLTPIASDTTISEIVVVNVTADSDVSSVVSSFGVGEILTTDNVGFGAAVNLGVRAISSSVVVIANDDLEVSPEALRRLSAMAADHGVAVPKLIDPDGGQIRSVRSLATPRTLLLEWLLLPDSPIPGLGSLPVEKWRQPKRPTRVSAATAAIVAVRTAVIRHYPLPEEYFLYWEEMEWYWTLHEAGVETWFDPTVAVIRRDGPTVISRQKAQLMARNAVRVVRRTQGRLSAMIAWVVVVMWSVRLVLVDFVRLMATGSGSDRVRVRIAGVRAAVSAVWEVV